jgi:hypothetical protein
MNVPNVRVVAGKRFFWDGREYSASDEAATAQTGYERDGFETCLADSEGTFLVYTRRVVTQVGDAKMN